MFRQLLIANRGEIACRIIKTAKKMGMKTIAIYSSIDKNARHVRLADEAYYVGESTASESYLNIDAMIKICQLSGAEAVHPGYGFLSENPDFAKACQKNTIIFVGPDSQAMEIMASKQLAKQLLETTNVPLIPGYHGDDQSDSHLRQQAQQIGFPVLLKAAFGGGGKGMRLVEDEAFFQEALDSARREAQAYFSNDKMIIEKLVMNPRHVEIQIMADQHDHIVHLFERDCSIQRRHQKIIEEAPATKLSPHLRAALYDAAIVVAQAIQYQGAGTVEFLVGEDQQFYFMEMNTRLQVEHPVTEMITGIDLVEWQLRIAAHEHLPLSQDKIHQQGHAIECRIYAEDPMHEFLPSIGKIQTLNPPQGAQIRIDTGVEAGDSISRFYDAMFAKLIVWGPSRTEAIQRLEQACMHFSISGIKTNIPFLQSIIQHPDFKNNAINTNFLTQHRMLMNTKNHEHILLFAASFDYLSHMPTDPLFQDTYAWQMHLHSAWYKKYQIAEQAYTIKIIPQTLNCLDVEINHQITRLNIQLNQAELFIENGTQTFHARIETQDNRYTIFTASTPTEVICVQETDMSDRETIHANHLCAPMPATIVAILKEKGDDIKKGDGLIVLDAMKMEHTIYAPHTGRITDIFYPVGAQVNEGVLLAAIDGNA